MLLSNFTFIRWTRVTVFSVFIPSTHQLYPLVPHRIKYNGESGIFTLHIEE